jgi:hypothetical protein
MLDGGLEVDVDVGGDGVEVVEVGVGEMALENKFSKENFQNADDYLSGKVRLGSEV